MKLLSAKFKGLIGICRASGLHQIKIDFTRCKHKIILIIGKNGSGKSTIEDALHPFPDPPSNYLPNEEGLKEIEYLLDGIIYKIRIEYPLNKNGERATTKAYIEKNVNGEITELNPNGNIGSYKDILYTEFKLDANFIALSQLSIENRGLVEKTPAERKKFVGNIIESIEVYNNIYKALNKRSSIYKSLINTIVAKIDTIGDEEKLLSTINSMELRIKSLQDQKDNYTKQLSDYEAQIKILDPYGNIQDSYNLYYNQNRSIKSQLNTINLFIASLKDKPYYSCVDSKESCTLQYKRIYNDINKLEIELSSKKSRISELLVEREEETKSVTLKINRLNSLTSEYNYMDLIKEIDRLKNNIQLYLNQFEIMGISPDTALTKDEFIIGLNTLKSIKEQVDIIRSYNYDDEIRVAVDNVKFDYNSADVLNKVKSNIEQNNQRLSFLYEQVKYNEGLLDRLSILNGRPKTCKNDNCSFIKDALKIRKKDPAGIIDKLTEEVKYLEDINKKEKDNLARISNIIPIENSINLIVRYIHSNKSILNKLPNGNIFSDIDIFLDKIIAGSTFSEIDDLYKYVDVANIFEQYKMDSSMLIRLESEYKIYQSKNEIIDEIQNDITLINKKLDSLLINIETTQSEIKSIEIDISNKKELLDTIESVQQKYDSIMELNNTLKENNQKLQEISNSVAAIENAIKKINETNSLLININNELQPSIQDLNKLKYSLDRLKEYKQEISIYQSKYDTIELIKKYSSPTKSGIQNLFIQVYMGQTLTLANSLLSMLFDGTLELKKYIINDKEFRIPCKSLESPIINDDISSCSTAQRSMISMILSFALLQQGSTKYNILRLDEIDSGLDQENRSKFLSVLQEIMNILKVENCIMVSHSSENVLEDMDIILLNPVGTEIPNGNIIFTYDECK